MTSGDVVYHKLTGEAFVLLAIHAGTSLTSYKDTCLVRDARYEKIVFYRLELQSEKPGEKLRQPEAKVLDRKLDV